MYLLEPREKPSQLMRWLSPLIALIAMLVVGSLLFFILGVDPAKALYIFFIEPLTSVYSLSELVIKAREAGVELAVMQLNAVPTSAFPTPAKRPHNSRLDTGKFQRTFDLVLPDWKVGVERMLTEILGK